MAEEVLNAEPVYKLVADSETANFLQTGYSSADSSSSTGSK